MTTAGKTWRRRKRERPQEIRAAALAEFSRQSFDTVTMDQIAGRAGVTKGTIYLYYASKQELFGTLLGELGDLGDRDIDRSRTAI
jgi:AcrR family transcriptional regulator